MYQRKLLKGGLLPLSDGTDSAQTSWRGALVGALITIVVTVVSGVAVYFITREKPAAPPHENVIYTVEHSATFEGGNGGITFLTLNVQNIGDKAARHVRVAVPFGKPWQLRDRRIDVSSGAAALYQDKSDGNQIYILFDSVVPNEKLKISALLNGPGSIQPHIFIQSDDSIGIPAPAISSDSRNDADDKKTVRLIGLVTAATTLQAGLLFYLYWRRSKLRVYPKNLNNTAFVLLLQGLVSDAENLLSKAIERDGGDPITLANHALALGLLGRDDLAAKRFTAARWLSRSKHQRAVITFDEAVLLIFKGDLSNAREKLIEAFDADRGEVIYYCELSIQVQSASQADEAIRGVIERYKTK